ncbi:hypothetical protein L3X38_036496 [Prunus dulcis]|uniref:Uncharacterized protein n=1 Tax=Prunus dulcis TaxID=3755 RepID=A0AAD4V2V5_PRUDU|nr:hypothetical protein L3X38_036496 [Prunus dulcis]
MCLEVSVLIWWRLTSSIGAVLPIKDIVLCAHDVGAKVLVDACQECSTYGADAPRDKRGQLTPWDAGVWLWRSQESSCRPLGQQLVDPLDALNVLDESPQRQRERLVDGLLRW